MAAAEGVFLLLVLSSALSPRESLLEHTRPTAAPCADARRCPPFMRHAQPGAASA